MAQVSKAHQAMIRARTQLLVSQPFYGTLALHLELVEVGKDHPLCEQIDTQAVDGKRWYYNPEWTLTDLTDQNRVAVAAHEVSHCAFQHMTRRGHRDPKLWNIAGDFVINADLKKAGFELPGQPIGMKGPQGVKGHLYDPQFDGMSTEEVYEKIYKQATKIYVSLGGGKDGDGKKDLGGCGSVLDAGAGHNKAKADEVAREWEATVRVAINVARANNAGQLPGYLERLVQQLKRPKVSWRDLTRQFIDNSMSKDFSYARPNRRYVGQGLVLPGYIADALHHLIMIVDVSGSISKEMMLAYVSEVAGALDDGVADKITVVYADTDVRHVDEFLQGDMVRAKVIAGGGTAFRESFEWVKKNAPDASCCIYLTDMMTSDWGEDPGMPVLWAAYLPDRMLDGISKPSFGDIIHCESPE